MVTLFCAVVGAAGSVFSVRVAEDDSVDDLKDAIKAKKMYQFPADELQLILAKKDEGRGAWVTEEEAISGVGDTTDLKLLGAARARLRRVGLSDKDVGGVDEEEEAEGRGPVNVLVVVPEQDNLRSPAMVLLEVMLPHILTHAPTTRTERNRGFKEQLCNFYGCYRRKKSWVRCMLLDVAFPKSLVIASRLFRRSNEYLSLVMMQISDIDDVKNGLLLFKPLEHAFGYFQISFIRDDTDAFRLKLFDPDIRDTRLIDLTDRNGNQVLSAEQIGVLFNSVSLAKKRCHFDVQTTFGDVDGSTLTFTGLERPFNRCLNLQARVARMIALKKHWIDASYDFPDFWSEVSLDDKMEMFHRSIFNADAIFWLNSTLSLQSENEINFYFL